MVLTADSASGKTNNSRRSTARYWRGSGEPKPATPAYLHHSVHSVITHGVIVSSCRSISIEFLLLLLQSEANELPTLTVTVRCASQCAVARVTRVKSATRNIPQRRLREGNCDPCDVPHCHTRFIICAHFLS